MPSLIDIITSEDPAVRDRPIESILEGRDWRELLTDAESLERYRHGEANLYRRG